MICLNSEEGWHQSTVDLNSGTFCDLFSSLIQPPIMRLFRLPMPDSVYKMHESVYKGVEKIEKLSDKKSIKSNKSSSCVCVLLSVIFDSRQSDTRLNSMISSLPPPVIEVRNFIFDLILFSHPSYLFVLFSQFSDFFNFNFSFFLFFC